MDDIISRFGRIKKALTSHFKILLILYILSEKNIRQDNGIGSIDINDNIVNNHDKHEDINNHL